MNQDELHEKYDGRLTHKSEAFQELFYIPFYKILDCRPSIINDDMFGDDPDIRFNSFFVIGVVLWKWHRDTPEYQEAVRRCVPKLHDDEWDRVRDILATDFTLGLDDDRLGELDQMRKGE